jgi:hypothetical protein
MGGEQEGEDAKGSPYVVKRVPWPLPSGLHSDETSPSVTKKVRTWLRMVMVNEASSRQRTCVVPVYFLRL